MCLYIMSSVISIVDPHLWIKDNEIHYRDKRQDRCGKQTDQKISMSEQYFLLTCHEQERE